jgi:hypothetical protein
VQNPVNLDVHRWEELATRSRNGVAACQGIVTDAKLAMGSKITNGRVSSRVAMLLVALYDLFNRTRRNLRQLGHPLFEAGGLCFEILLFVPSW